MQLSLLLGFALMSCAPTPNPTADMVTSKPQAFKDYWYQGKAELTRYELSQSRYGELHEGHAVMIFVTEDFLQKEQVKRDFGSALADSVLKLNATKKFLTGIYPYSVMTSVFTKVDFDQPETPKVTFSSQEWCGHVFMQFNLKNDAYEAMHRSYFQSEGDREYQLPHVLLEDEVWTMIRLRPEKLPVGDIEAIPSMEFLRLRHKEAAPRKAKAELVIERDRDISKEKLFVYKLEYKDGRSLAIHFEQEAPYRIMGWREITGSGKNEETLAVRTDEMVSPYWSQNGKDDRKIRKQLGLSDER